MLGTLKWGVMCIMQAWSHLSGASRSMELATIGRRVCENEWDLLGLLPGDPLARHTPTVPDPAAALHDRPTLSELVEAVREWVDDDVRSGTEGRLSFHARVAANALRHRGARARAGTGPDRCPRRAAGAARAALTIASSQPASEPASWTTGSTRCVGSWRQSVHDKLLVANPGWLDEA